ncbi:hypothetical protein ASU64_00820, partial [Enterobacter hormaechei subsp. hoffmannii]
SVRHIFKPISYLEIQLLSGVSGGYINQYAFPSEGFLPCILQVLLVFHQLLLTPLLISMLFQHQYILFYHQTWETLQEKLSL